MEGFRKAIELYDSRGHEDVFQPWFETDTFYHHEQKYYWFPLLWKTYKLRIYAGIEADGTRVFINVWRKHITESYIADELDDTPYQCRFGRCFVTEWMNYNLEMHIPTNVKDHIYATINYVIHQLPKLPRGRYFNLALKNIWVDSYNINYFSDFGCINRDDPREHPDLLLPDANAGLMALYSIGRLLEASNLMVNISHALCRTDPKERVFNRTVEETLQFLLDAASV